MGRTISTRFVIDGESDYRATLKKLNAEMSLHKSELEKVQAQYKNSANSMEALTAKQSALQNQLKTLNQKHSEQAAMVERAREAQRNYADQAEKLRQKLDALKGSSTATAEEQKKLAEDLSAAEENAEKAADAAMRYQKQLNLTERDQYKLGDELKRTEQYLGEAKLSADECATSIDQYGKEVKAAGEISEKFAGGAQESKEAIDQLAAALAAAGIAKSVKEIADALMECVDTFASFQEQMSTVQAISGASGDDLAALGEKAREMGSTTSFTATEAAQALEYMAMAGWKTDEMLGGLEGVMHLAAASGESLASTSDIVTDALTAFGISASDSAHFADVLAAASSNSNTNVSMMGETFKSAAPVAGALGYSIEDVALAVGLMANAGIKGDRAGTALRGTLTNLAKPSKQVAGYMEQLGVSLTDSSGQVRSLSDLMDLLRDRFSALTEAQKAEYAAGIAGKESMSGLLAIVNASETDYQKLSTAIDRCSGSAKEMADIRLDNYAGQMTLLSSAADDLKLAVGEQLTPALTNLAEAGTDALAWGADFIEANPELVGVIAGLTGATGLLVAAVGGFAVVQTITPMVTAFNAALAANPAGAVALAISGVVTALGTFALVTGSADDEVHDLSKSLRESKTAYEELTAAMKSEQSSARKVAASLADLLDVEQRSEVQKDQLARRVEELNELMPELGLVYDKATDSLNTTADAMMRMVENAERQEEYNAQIDRLNELYGEQTEIAQLLEEAQGELAVAYESGVTHAEAYERSSGSAGAAVRSLEGDVQRLTAAQSENAAQIAELEASTSAYAEHQGALDQKVEEMTRRVEGLASEMKQLQTAYQESYDAAMDSISQQLGLFNDLDGKAKTSVDNLISTLKNQVAYMEEYSSNIQKAMEMGVDQGLVRKLSDGSQESAQILDAIVKGGQEKVDELNRQFAKVEEGKKKFSDTIAQMETDFNAKMQKMMEDYNRTIKEMDIQDDTYIIGRNNIQGLINGTDSMKAVLAGKYAQLAREALAAYKREMAQVSPSKKFKEVGQNDIKGAILGVEEEKQRFVLAYEETAKAAVDGMRRHLPSTTENPSAAALDRQVAAILSAVSDKEQRSGGSSVYVDKLVVRDDSDIHRIARELYDLTRRESRGRGGGGL